MEIVDLQLHEPAPFEDWGNASAEIRQRVLTEALWQSMDAVGVNAAVLNPMEDLPWAESLSARYPDRIAWVFNIHAADLDEPDIDAHIQRLFGRTGVIGLRFEAVPAHAPEQYARLKAGGFDAAFASCQKHGIPVWLGLWGVVDAVHDIARKFPDMQIIVDHIGINQPPFHPRDNPPWKDLGTVVELAQYENVAIKLCGAISLSDQAFPYADAWSQVARLLDAYGAERLAWASDIQRSRGRAGYQVRVTAPATADGPAQYKFGPDAHVPGPPPNGPVYPGKHNYMESLGFILYNDHLSSSEKEQILGGTTRRLMNWPARQGR